MARVTDRYLEDRRAEILEAAKRVFIRKGYDSATMQDIASEADVAAGSLYRYFPGKSDLIAAVLEQCCDEDRTLFPGPDDPVRSPLLALLQAGEREHDDLSATDSREQCVLRLESYLAATRDGALLALVTDGITGTREQIAALLRAAQEAGEVDPSYDANDLAQAIHAFVAGIHLLHLPMGDRLDIDRTWEMFLRLISNTFLVNPRELLESEESSANE